MKKRNVLIRTTNKIYHSYKNVIEMIVMFLMVIAIFIGSYIISANHFTNDRLSEKEIAIYEQIAREIHEKGTGQLEVPKGVNYKIDNGIITIYSSAGNHRDKVVAKRQDDKLITTVEYEDDVRIAENILFGFEVIVLIVTLIEVAKLLYKKVKNVIYVIRVAYRESIKENK